MARIERHETCSGNSELISIDALWNGQLLLGSRRRRTYSGRHRSVGNCPENIGGGRQPRPTHSHFDHVASVDALRAAIPEVLLLAGARESRMLNGDRSLDPGETGKTLRGFLRIRTSRDRTLNEGDCVASLQTVFSPGHTPGHMAFLDRRDGTLLAGDAFTTQIGVVAAGFFKFYFRSLGSFLGIAIWPRKAP